MLKSYAFRLSFLTKRSRYYYSTRKHLLRSNSNGFDIDAFFNDPKSVIDQYWINQLKRLEKPSSIDAIRRVDKGSKLGFKAGSKKVASDMESNRKIHPHKIILCRMGDFYETYGIDAIMLHNYCGLKLMGDNNSELKAGTKWQNVQELLDQLVDAGLVIAIYEQLKDNNADRGPSKSKAAIIERPLSAVIHRGNPTYAYDVSLSSEDINYKESIPIWGILKTSSGYDLYEVIVDEGVVRMHVQLTKEGVKTYLDEGSYAEPVYINTETMSASDLPFLPTTEPLNCPNKEFCSQLLREIQSVYSISQDKMDRFQIANIPSKNRPRSLYISTAEEIGLTKNAHVKPLVPCLLPKSHSAYCARFLQDWIMHPPNYDLTKNMQNLCQLLATSDISLPRNNPIPFGKVNSLLNARECNVPLFQDIYSNVQSVLEVLNYSDGISDDNNNNYEICDNLVKNLLPIVEYRSSLHTDRDSLRRSCREIIKSIESVVSITSNHYDRMNNWNLQNHDLCTKDPNENIPDEFFLRNENDLRGNLNLSNQKVKEVYMKVNEKAKNLIDITQKQFPSNTNPKLKIEFLDDSINNIFGFKETPELNSLKHVKIITAMAKTQKGEKRQTKKTTEEIQAATIEYLSAIEDATDTFKNILKVSTLCFFI